MINVVGLTKSYRPKRGAEVKAVRGVSFSLPDAGMVFILGKSGCGKSTLLNLLGGLDGFDGGDVTVDGRSMKAFSARDLDIHRNYYTGFVFQENNLLDGYTVERNVALALDLQREKDTAARVQKALEEVGIGDLARQKCHSVSGGQKQRVAIARALVKHPKLLLCDEPTGALDSETGEEIFALLKDISKSTLVVAVSHDRDSAEKYGDRIIELKDGEILSDSAPLPSGEPAEEPAAESKNAKRGGLPAKRVFGIAAGYLIAKPVRLALCVVICILTFTCVGIADAGDAYDATQSLVKTMYQYKSDHISYRKNVVETDPDGDIHSGDYNFTAAEYAKVKGKIRGGRLDVIYEADNECTGRSIESLGYDDDRYDSRFEITGFAEVDGELVSDYGFTLLSGRYPKAYDEVLLPAHFYNAFKKYGYIKNPPKFHFAYDSSLIEPVDLIAERK